MAVYNCEHCNNWKDGDYHPPELLEDGIGLVCDDCFAEVMEVSNEQEK
jgi:hypothetical protein